MPRNFNKRFVYIGTVNEEKGIEELIEVAKQLDETYTLDVYGPLIEKKYSEEYFEKHLVSYKGALVPDGVIHVMNNYDMLILPSYREGYPGVVIEAFSLGIPVIATRLTGIMEMIDDYQNGILIEPKKSKQLLNAILAIDENNYGSFSENAFASYDNFDSHLQTEKFLKLTGIIL